MNQLFKLRPGDAFSACWSVPARPADPVAREAHAWAWFAALFGAPLDPAELAAIREGRSAPWTGFLVDDPEGAALREALDTLVAAEGGTAAAADRLLRGYIRLVDGPSRESVHVGAAAAQEMAGLLDRIGLDPTLPADHVATELRALALLTRREDPRRGPMLWRLARWTDALRAACAACDPTGVYGAAAAALAVEVRREAAAIFPDLAEPVT